MIISKEQLSCHVCSTDEERASINYISFEKDGAVSTNGKTILIVPYPNINDNDLFETAESIADAKYKLKENENIMVRRDVAKHVSQNFFKTSETNNDVQTFAAMEVKNNDIHISMISPVVDKEFETIKASIDFPSWKGVLPKTECTSQMNFNISELFNLMKQLKSASQCTFARFTFHGETGIVKIETEDGIVAYTIPASSDEE